MSEPLEAVRQAEARVADALPSPSGVAVEVLALTQREDACARDVARVIQADPALTGRLLKFANSASVSLRRPVVAIEDAIVVLGVHVVRQLALGLSVLSNARSGPCKAFDYGTFWSRSLATGLALQALCLARRPFPPEEAFVCGLLARVGELGLASLHPEDYTRVLAAGDDDLEAIIARERQITGTDQLELSGILLSDWGLPAVHAQAALNQIDSRIERLADGSRDRTLAQLLRLAGGIARICVAPEAVRDAHVAALTADGESLGFAADALETLFDQVAEEWRGWARLLEVPATALPPFAKMVEHAASDGNAPSRAPTGGLRVLVVDDDPVTVRLLQHQLEAAGHRVVTASDGREGLRRAVEDDPQLVITDWIMPGLDGIQLCRALREARAGRLLHIIMLTVHEDEEHLIEALEAGADDYIPKPFSPRILAARIRGGERLIRLQAAVEREREENRRHLAQLALMNRRLRQAATTDALTELPNRRFALEQLAREWSGAERSGEALACLMVDVDHFKRVNDRFGHETGDATLRHVAGLLRRAARASDFVCRLGGEEFLVISAGTDASDAMRLAQRLCKTVEEFAHETLPGEDRITISVGLALRDAHMRKPEDLIRLADRALLAAKRSGRNRVCAAY